MATKDLNMGVKRCGENISNLKFADDVAFLTGKTTKIDRESQYNEPKIWPYDKHSKN